MLTSTKQVPEQTGFLTKDASHVCVRCFVLDGLGKVSGLFVQRAVAEDSVERIIFCREPCGLENKVQSLTVVVDEDATELVINLTRHRRGARGDFWRAVVTYAKDVGNVQALALAECQCESMNEHEKKE